MEDRLRRRLRDAFDQPGFPSRDLVWRAMERIDEEPDRSHRREWAIALAALLLAAAALATFSLVSQRLVQKPQPAHSPEATAPPVRAAESPIGGPGHRVYFVSPEVGWRVVTPLQPSQSPVVLSKTTDGGKTWNDQLSWKANAPTYARFDDARSGIVVARSPGEGTFIWRTTDGTNWQKSAAPSDFGQASFVSAREGWYTYAVGRTGSVYHTTDAGQTWKKVGTLTLPNDNFGGHTVYFGDASTGYVPGGDFGKMPPIYVTHDGGATWSAVEMPAPPSLGANKQVAVTSIHFAEGKTFVVADVYTPIQASYYVYVSGDGGRTWSQARSLPEGAGPALNAVDGSHLWAAGNWAAGSELWRSADAGQTWTKVPATLPPPPAGYRNPGAHFSEIEFLSSNVGWAFLEQQERCVGQGGFGSTLGWPPCGDKEGATRFLLIRTTDGGKTWTEVAPLS